MSQLRRLARRPKGSKYGNVHCEVDGLTFDSQREARHYQELRLREKAGEIEDLMVQPRYECVVNGIKICAYVADFKFREVHRTGYTVADSKGMKTAVYRLKKKLMLAIHGIEIREL